MASRVSTFRPFSFGRKPHYVCSQKTAESTLEVEQFLSYLAVEGKVAASTQNQALAALLFLYREVLEQDFSWLGGLNAPSGPHGYRWF